MSRGFIRFINLSIAGLLIVVIFAAYWLAYLPLPQISGSIKAPISQHATVTRDAQGVPHIVAGSWEDAVFLQGFVTAQDRLWQMDSLRRLAAGDLSEIAGSAALPLDREARQLRMRAIAETQYKTMNLTDRAVIAAYARGVNYFIETHRNRLPLEFSIPFRTYDPRPWSAVDTILAGLQMSRNLTTTWRDEIQKKSMLLSGDAARVNFLFPSRIGNEVQPGSNAWAVAGARTASGRPILANDPHLEFSVPSTWYMVHLRAPDLNVSGVSLPGVPCVIIGHNDRIAWGVTNLHYDVQDVYEEKFDPQTGRYVFRGQMEQARLAREFIPVRGGKPVEVATWVTRHGPVIAGEGNRYLALRWAAAAPDGFEFPFLDLNRAKNWQDFTAAIGRFYGPGQNFVYADVEGNIGYHASGRLPVRRSYDGDVPMDGSSGEYEWDGYIPFEQLPSSYNPPSGMIVTANQNPFPEGYAPSRVHGNFASPYRSRQIQTLLSAHSGWQPDQMLAVQKDVYSAFSKFLAEQVVKAYRARGANNPDLKDAVELLQNWSGQMEKGMAAPLIAALVFQHLRKTVADRAAPGKGAGYELHMAPAVLEDLLRRRPKDWFSDYDQVLVKCLSEAVDEGKHLQRGNVNKWDYGQYNELNIVQPVGNQFPLVGKYFNIGPVPMSGSSTTVKQTTRRLGPSMRMVVDLANLDHSFQNITVGESGQILSSHYKDQWDAYYVAHSFPMQFLKVDGKAVLTVEPSR